MELHPGHHVSGCCLGITDFLESLPGLWVLWSTNLIQIQQIHFHPPKKTHTQKQIRSTRRRLHKAAAVKTCRHYSTADAQCATQPRHEMWLGPRFFSAKRGALVAAVGGNKAKKQIGKDAKQR